jgi:hypothetical protein
MTEIHLSTGIYIYELIGKFGSVELSEERPLSGIGIQ